MGLSKEKMLEFLEEADLSAETKSAICDLIAANNQKLKEEVPNVVAKSIRDNLGRRGIR